MGHRHSDVSNDKVDLYRVVLSGREAKVVIDVQTWNKMDLLLGDYKFEILYVGNYVKNMNFSKYQKSGST